jgi:glycyl-tRNA synthetase
MAEKATDTDKVMELARRRGFIWASFEIYGGVAGFYDYGPLGAKLKRRIEAEWRDFYTQEGFYEIETTNVAPREIFEASGHLKSFADRVVKCSKCERFFRPDIINESGGRCPECNAEVEEYGDFNLMFQTKIGMKMEKSEGYLRPETAQGMFLNFFRLLRFNREKLPLGVFQIGKAYRNEIAPRQSIIRLREFTLAEVEVFVAPDEKDNHPKFVDIKDRMLRLVPGEGEAGEKSVEEAVRRGIIANEYLAYHIAKAEEFLDKIGLAANKLRFRQHRREEMAHYARDCWDVEFLSPRYGWMEIVGIADRGDYDLRAHISHANVDQGQNQKEKGKIIIPHVIEPSFGIDRIIYALLESSFYEERVKKEKRNILRFKREIAPVRAAVFPLMAKEELKSKARAVFEDLRKESISVEYDETGSIGRRYRRQDEIGTPYCITIDYETLEDDTVTIRDRDTMKQVRVPIAEVKDAV